MTIAGLGPHGERAAPPERVSLLPEDIAAARAETRRVAIVLHTLDGDWTRLQISGMLGVFGDCGVVVDDEWHPGLATNGEEFFGPGADIVFGMSLRPELDHIDAALNHFGGDADQRRRRGVAEIDDAIEFGGQEGAAGHGERGH